jgi:hypothetical protein
VCGLFWKLKKSGNKKKYAKGIMVIFKKGYIKKVSFPLFMCIDIEG